MAQFPKSEAEIAVLAQAMAAGLETHATVYPSPPVTPDNLTAAVEAFLGAKNAAGAAQALAMQAVGAKDEALETLKDRMKEDLRYAENTVKFDDGKLRLIGWGGRSADTALAVPGQTRSLAAPRQGEGWIFLDWKQPTEGGAVASYKIQRRLRPEGPWLDVSMAVESEATLMGQERGKEFEYRVSAVNKAGEGEPSNTVMAVL